MLFVCVGSVTGSHIREVGLQQLEAVRTNPISEVRLLYFVSLQCLIDLGEGVHVLFCFVLESTHSNLGGQLVSILEDLSFNKIGDSIG